MADLQIGINIENSQAEAAARAVAQSLANIVNLAKQAGDAQEAAGNRGVQATNRLRDAQGRYVAGQAQVAKGQKEVASGFDMTTGAASSLYQVLGSVGAQFGFMALAQQGIGLIAQSFRDMATGVYDANVALGEQREKLAELAALKGLLGMSTEAMRQDLGFRAETLQTAADARLFQESALGAGQSGIDATDALTGKVTKRNFIGQSEFDKLMVQAGKFQSVEGGDATAEGKLAGMMPMLMGRRVTGDEAFAKMMQLYNISQPGNASFSSMTSMLLKNAPLTSAGIFKDVADQMALTSMFSTTAGEGAGEMVQQFTRGTVGALGKMRGVKGFEGADSEKQAEYLKRIGATSAMDPIAIGKLISADMAEQQKAQGEKFSAMLYLQSKGYGNQEDVMALMAFSAKNQTGEWQTFADLAGAAPDAGKTMAQIEARRNADPRMRARQVGVMKELADVQLGAGAPEYFQTLMQSTFEQMKGKGEVAGDFGSLMKAGWLTGDPMAGSRRSSVQDRARWMLQQEARRVGVTAAEMAGVKGKTDEERLYGLANLIGQHGGRTLPGLEGMAAVADKMLGTEKAREDRIKAVRMEPKPALPVGPAVGEPMRVP